MSYNIEKMKTKTVILLYQKKKQLGIAYHMLPLHQSKVLYAFL